MKGPNDSEGNSQPPSRACGAEAEIPTQAPYDEVTVTKTGYPEGCFAACLRAAGHDGMHWVCLPLASGPGSFTWGWADEKGSQVPDPICSDCDRTHYRKGQ